MTPAFRPSVQVIPVQQPYLHQATLDLTLRPEGALGVSPQDMDKTLYLTVKLREADVTATRGNEAKLMSMKDDIIAKMESRIRTALGL